MIEGFVYHENGGEEKERTKINEEEKERNVCRIIVLPMIVRLTCLMISKDQTLFNRIFSFLYKEK